jgi:hypothetical protein
MKIKLYGVNDYNIIQNYMNEMTVTFSSKMSMAHNNYYQEDYSINSLTNYIECHRSFRRFSYLVRFAP